jgi:hypothetical protein
MAETFSFSIVKRSFLKRPATVQNVIPVTEPIAGPCDKTNNKGRMSGQATKQATRDVS